jgi:hypothetical protein
MNRRSFLERSATGLAAGLFIPTSPAPRVHHVILVAPSGARKKDYYQNASLAPNLSRLAVEGFVYEEDHCDTVTFHREAFAEMVQGRADCYYLNDSTRLGEVMREARPRIVVLRDMHHDAGHEANNGYEQYLDAIRETDSRIGALAQWVRSDPYFRERTAIVFRPEFGRDDVVNRYGELHHSPGFYCTHRVASIFWGPTVKSGVERRLVNRKDFALRLKQLFG